MSYNIQKPPYLTTAGKVTIFTTLFGVVAFLLIFLFNIGQSEFQAALAQSGNATTSVNVLNTPPDWTVDAQEEFESSALFPTNSGNTVSWTATGTDTNGAPYFLILCTTNATPTANSNVSVPGTVPPTCDGGNGNQIAVSTSTVSATQARAATTTLESFSESNDWYAWICDDDATYARCNDNFRQGSGTTSSPFIVNHRPTFGVFSDDSPADPGALVTFSSNATDTDSVGGADTMRLFVCNENDFNYTTLQCGPGGEISSSTLTASNPSATYTLPAVIQDQDYTSFGFIVDNHGHPALGGAQATDSILSVNNVAPTIDGSQISLNNGDNLTLVVEAGQTTGYRLAFVVNDANSCENSVSADEVVDVNVSVFRSGIGSSTCDATGTGYNPNNCYTSGVATTTWNVSCAATTTPADCTGPTDSSVTWECTFPLWYVADPTDGVNSTTSLYYLEDWRAAASAIDDDAATGPFTMSTAADIEVEGLLAFALNSNAIPYGDLAPGNNTGTLRATTTASSTGNVGVDTLLSGILMCPDFYTIGTCPASATSSIPVTEQEYGTSSLPYGTGVSLTGSDALLQLSIPKPTATNSLPARNAYWGIEVPGTVSLAGIYTGQNTFVAAQSNPSRW